jgi:hypothetical protein
MLVGTTALSHLKLASNRTCHENWCAEGLPVALEGHGYCDFTDTHLLCMLQMYVSDVMYKWTHFVCINDISRHTGVCASAVLCINCGTFVFVFKQSDV